MPEATGPFSFTSSLTFAHACVVKEYNIIANMRLAASVFYSLRLFRTVSHKVNVLVVYCH